MSKGKNNRQDKRNMGSGRRAPSFLAIPHIVLESEEYSKLGAWSVKLLIDIAAQYRGNNNGDLHMAFSILSKKGWKSKSTLAKAKKELIEHGFIVKTRTGHRGGLCDLFAITWKSIDECKGKHLEVSPTRTPWKAWSQPKR